MITEIKLVDSGDEFVLLPSSAVFVSELDCGLPEIRSVTEDRTDDHGTRDTTEFYGASAVSLALLLVPDPANGVTARSTLDRLGRFCRPNRRPFLQVSDTDWPTGPRRVHLRADQMSKPFVAGQDPLGVVTVQVQFRAPEGAWELVELRDAVLPGINPEPPVTQEVATADALGTHSTTRLVATDADAVGFLAGGDMYLYDSLGALKESTRFQVTDLSSGFGFTNIDFSPPAAVSVVSGDQFRQDQGITFPLILPMYFTPATSASGQIIDLSFESNTEVHFVARLYGPCLGPRLTNDTTGQTLSFGAGLEIFAGDYLEINTRERSALYLSQAGASRLNHLDYTVSSWFKLEPGPNTIRYHPLGNVGPTTAAQIEYRPILL